MVGGEADRSRRDSPKASTFVSARRSLKCVTTRMESS